jgi:hypothetical protein
MHVKINDKIVCELTEIQQKVIKNDIPSEIFDEDIERRVNYILSHKYQRCLERLRQEWEPILKKDLPSIPSNDEEFAELVFARADYKNKSQRNLEAELKR